MFTEVKNGEWFHKMILLKKEGDKYLFNHRYKIKPASFSSIIKTNSILMTCKSECTNGYSYVLSKEIELSQNKFKVFLKKHR